MNDNNPVFIVGPARSGTSLLYRILQKHPVFVPQNRLVSVDLTESRVFSDPDTIYDKGKMRGGGCSFLSAI
jgi:hypothetical protein